MKLKSKLIATIVSICAAVAVMGVGVWAAGSSFEVTVTNNVAFSFVGLDGTVKLTTANVADNETAAQTNISNETLYDGSETVINKIQNANVGEETTTLAHNIVNYFQKDAAGCGIDAKTKGAYVEYTFTYDAASVTANTVSTKVTVTQDSSTTPTLNQTDASFKIYYLISTDNSTWVQLTSGTAVYVDASVDFYVKAVLVYSNPNAVSITGSGNWVFTVAMSADAAVDTETAIKTGAATTVSGASYEYRAGSAATTIYSAVENA